MDLERKSDRGCVEQLRLRESTCSCANKGTVFLYCSLSVANVSKLQILKSIKIRFEEDLNPCSPLNYEVTVECISIYLAISQVFSDICKYTFKNRMILHI